MAINKNHLFEDLNGVKCAIVETNVPEYRVTFLKSLLEYNGFTVVVVPEAPKVAAVAPEKAAVAVAAAVPPVAEKATEEKAAAAVAAAVPPVAEKATEEKAAAVAAAVPPVAEKVAAAAAAAVPPVAETETPAVEGVPTAAAAAAPSPPTSFKIGVTDVSYNTTNAIYGRLLKTRDGRIVTMAYWLQKEQISNDEVPYFDKKD